MVPIDHAYRVVIEERIAELWRFRSWWRTNRWADWPEVRREEYAELRALVALARKARRLEATADRDAISYAKWEAERQTWTAA